MKVYTYSEARQHFATVLKEARCKGGVRIKRRGGEVYALRLEPSKKSPLDVEGISLGLTRKQIVDIIRESRRPRKRGIL